MKKDKIALGAGLAVSLGLSGAVTAAENPFSMQEFESGMMIAAADGDKKDMAKGRDMEGNPVDYEYGGDTSGSYADGKIGTGVKDPAVCGTFTEAVCGAAGGGHLKK